MNVDALSCWGRHAVAHRIGGLGSGRGDDDFNVSWFWEDAAGARRIVQLYHIVEFHFQADRKVGSTKFYTYWRRVII